MKPEQRSGAFVATPADIIRIRAFVSHVGKSQTRGHPWLHDFQHAIFTDPDLDHALVTDDVVLARNALAAISFRLYRDNPPQSIRSSYNLLGIEIR